MNNYFERGSLWHQWDLHFHTPSSFDYKNKEVTNKQIVETLVSQDVRVVAITDHHTMDVGRIRELQTLGEGKLAVLPGIEFRSDQGGSPIHYISIFAEDCDLDHVWDTMRGKLDLTVKSITDQGGDDFIYVPIEEGAKVTHDLGGIVTIHAGSKSNSIENIKNTEQFQMRIKANITSKWVDLMEIGQIKDIDIHHKAIFPTIGFDRPLAICSDNHNITQYERKTPFWLKSDPTFKGLLMAIKEPSKRVFIGEMPPEIKRVAENSTKYIKNVAFSRSPDTPAEQKWFSEQIPFNPGLVAIIGNKGSGKSALSDTIGLLGATKNFDSFSFLSKSRFKHPKASFASHFNAEIEWQSGERVSHCLSDYIQEEEPERLKYLPQDHVEKICNELDGVGNSDFEQELKSVIFSHVSDSQKLGHATLDDLVQFRADENKNRIDSLLKQLKEVSRRRAVAEEKLNPKMRRELEEQIKLKTIEIEVHDKAKPKPAPNPNEEDSIAKPDAKLLQKLKEAEEKKTEITALMSQAMQETKVAERKNAVTMRLLERLKNYRKEHDVFISSITEDARELGLDANKFITLTFNTSQLDKINDEAIISIQKAKEQTGSNEKEGLQLKLFEVNVTISDIHKELDAPNRAYQEYLKTISEWRARRDELVGDLDSPNSLEGLKATLDDLGKIPVSIAEFKSKQLELSKEILFQKKAHADVLRELYGPVQSFIDSHTIAQDKFKLEFKAELIDQGFSSQLLKYIAQNRKGSFMGTDEGRAKAVSLAERVNWAEELSVRDFLDDVEKALHEDQREQDPLPVQLADQLVKGYSAESLFTFLYGLEYVEPRYALKWEGKDLSVLSPGERGTLLLVFYLLVDKGDLPLIIDQPEGNLDNHTVAKVLVDCIREARDRRQVFIVTHNPNLAVVCDADQIVYASMDKENRNSITYTSGSLENPKMSQYITDVLEGTRWAFGIRGDKYKVGEKASV